MCTDARQVLASLTELPPRATQYEPEPRFWKFASWLAVHNIRSRKRLDRLHPSGLIYVGERATCSADEKREIVPNLRRECFWNP